MVLLIHIILIKISLFYTNQALRFENDKDMMMVQERLLEKITPKIYNRGSFAISLHNNPVNIKNNKPILCYYVGYSDAFNGKNYQDRNVWGSEIAAVRLCEELTKWYKCYIFCVCKQEEQIEYNGVQYYHLSGYETFQMNNEVDILLVSRYVHFFLGFTILSKKTYFLLHDARIHNLWLSEQLPDNGNAFFSNILHNIEKIVCVSDWQATNFERFSGISKNVMKVIPNGYNPKNFKGKFDKIKNRFIYASDPVRGLSVLCAIFPKIREQIPDATLDIYYDQIKDMKLLEIINNCDYINFHGKISNKQLAIELMKSDFWFYPNFFSHETFCLTCLEALAAGCVVITRKFSGLVTTVGNAGVLIDGKGEDFINEAFDIIIKIANDNKLKRKYQEKARQHAKQFKWVNVAKQWRKFLIS